MRQFAPLIALLSLLLVACYTSTTLLLDPSAARQPWPSSTWSETHSGMIKNYRATKRGDGWYDYAEQDGNGGKWEEHPVLLNDLATLKGRTLYAYAMHFPPGDDGLSYIYGAVVALPNGKWKAVTPDCDSGIIGGIAKSHGAMRCQFTSRGQLLDALREYANTPQFLKEVEEP
jgi:hypothetical protein